MEIWTFLATNPNDCDIKPRPILVIGDDARNGLKFVDIHYAIISSSADCGAYDVEINEEVAKSIGLKAKSVIKTTKLYTGPNSKLGNKVGDLPEDLKDEFIKKFKDYQETLINNIK